MAYRLFGILLLFFSPVAALAGDVMFEGYYRIELEHKPIGYNIQRYEFDPKSKTFSSISFLRAKFGDKTVQESLKAKANDKFEPISYQYTSQVGDQVKTIDGSFKGQIMKLATSDGKKVRNETFKIPKGTFLSSFLVYILMQKKLAPNDAFKYSAVAEEDGNSYYGKSWLESKEDKGSYVVFRILNSFKGEKFVSNMAAIPDAGNPDHYVKAEVLGTDSPVKNISTELVASPSQATAGQLVPNKILLTVFGNMPTGKLNLVATPPPAAAAPAAAAAAPAGGKGK
jgi:hypothetical protein